MFFAPDPEDFAPLATRSESVSEWARNVGWYDRYKDSAWLLHDWDVWVANPHYTGPYQPHPEDAMFDEREDDPENDMPPVDPVAWMDTETPDDIPF